MLTVRWRAAQTRLLCSSSLDQEKPRPSMLRHLTSKIKATGPISVAEYMREVLTNPVTVSGDQSSWSCRSPNHLQVLHQKKAAEFYTSDSNCLTSYLTKMSDLNRVSVCLKYRDWFTSMRHICFYFMKRTICLFLSSVTQSGLLTLSGLLREEQHAGTRGRFHHITRNQSDFWRGEAGKIQL